MPCENVVFRSSAAEALQFAHPELSYALDGDAGLATATRRALLQDCAARNVIIAATHLAFPGVGKVSEKGTGYRFVPL